ncbi:MAG: hypothetical protein HC896_01495 [Bacteroidales bacterium]|nr:hypothetical protein [Bacteroidales bacterium]
MDKDLCDQMLHELRYFDSTDFHSCVGNTYAQLDSSRRNFAMYPIAGATVLGDKSIFYRFSGGAYVGYKKKETYWLQVYYVKNAFQYNHRLQERFDTLPSILGYKEHREKEGYFINNNFRLSAGIRATSWLTISLAHDKIHVGDGYHSLFFPTMRPPLPTPWHRPASGNLTIPI